MTKNQLFCKVPSKEFVIKVLKICGIDGFDVSKSFTLKDLNDRQVIKYLEDVNIKSELQSHYLKCKWKYITKLTPKKCLTLMRQLLRLYGYKISSREKCIKGVKFCIYQICENSEEITVTEELSKELKVCFD